ncbi:MAG: hypothetical protein FJ194_18215 [Gammaproteobacteria bacterium]|nr:hypothetical protein [Gammaproteobacteria bacterium]
MSRNNAIWHTLPIHEFHRIWPPTTSVTAASPPNASRQNGSAAWLVSIVTGFSLLGDQALYAVLPVMHESLGLSAIQVGILLSINRWIRLLTNSWAHRAAETYAASLLLPLALAVGAATTALYAVTSSFMVLLIA